MTTVSDPQEYSSVNTKLNVTIKGMAGKKIKIEAISLQLISGKDGVMNSTVVSINGTPWGAWKYTAAKYSEILTYSRYPPVIEAGKDAVITWTINTNNSAYPAKFKNASYSYSFVDVGTSDDSTTENVEYIIIKCAAGESAALLTQLKTIAPTAEIGTISKV